MDIYYNEDITEITKVKFCIYTNANIMAGLGIVFVCWDCGWCSFHGISVDKIASKSKYLVPPKLSAIALISYISQLDIDKLYADKKFIHDMTFYKCVDNTCINFNSKLTSKELESIIQIEINKKINLFEDRKYISKDEESEEELEDKKSDEELEEELEDKKSDEEL